MSLLNQIVTPTTYASAGVSGASAVTSKIVELVGSSSSTVEMAQKTTEVISTTNTIAVCSFLVALATFIVNYIFKKRKDAREKQARLEEHQLFLKEEALLRKKLDELDS